MNVKRTRRKYKQRFLHPYIPMDTALVAVTYSVCMLSIVHLEIKKKQESIEIANVRWFLIYFYCSIFEMVKV